MLLSVFRNRPVSLLIQKEERKFGISEKRRVPWVAGYQAGQAGLQAGWLGWATSPQAGQAGPQADFSGRSEAGGRPPSFLSTATF